MSQSELTRLLSTRRSIRAFADQPVPLGALENMLFAAKGKTDATGNRTTPSAHALHPLRVYVVAARVDGLTPGTYVMSVDTGALELTNESDARAALYQACIGDQPWIAEAPCIVTLCADFQTPVKAFADQIPYGRRGERYVYIEAGAAAQNMLLQAHNEGLGSVLVAGFRDEETATVLELPAPLSPVLHLPVGYPVNV